MIARQKFEFSIGRKFTQIEQRISDSLEGFLRVLFFEFGGLFGGLFGVLPDGGIRQWWRFRLAINDNLFNEFFIFDD